MADDGGAARQADRFPIGSSRAILELDRLIHQVARYDSTVLLEGESGSGKELVARRIHDFSERRNAPFVPVNCGAIPKELLESELFGHEKGAFTGAITTRIGRFELADGGTLFLDEIGDMSLEMQVKLLRVLQERVFERVGSHETRRADVRILAASHRDLAARVQQEQFREDLFFRLNVFPIRVPALRERLEDLPELLENLVQRGRDAGRPGLCFGESALECMRTYRWPGNVRELQNLVERLCILYPEKTIERQDLPPPVGSERRAARSPLVTIPSDGLDLRAHLGEIERQLIRAALERSDGTVAQAARLLRLQRTTLVEKLRKHGLQASNDCAA